jgi:nucleotide-binding universal stress UspA family protein
MTAILVPMDGNPPSEAALDYALAEFPNADITVVHVIGVVDTAEQAQRASGDRRERLERAQAEAEALFEGVQRRAAEAGVDVATETAFGPPSRTIPDLADDFDRVVMGEHGQSGARRILLGSVAETVVRRAPVPVTVVRSDDDGDGATERDRRFLVAVDGSPLSERAIEYVLTEHDPEALTLLHVIDPTDPGYGAEKTDVRRQPVRGSEAWFEWAESESEELLAEAREAAPAAEGVELTTETEAGDPARLIVDRTKASDVDHVVMGSHGRSGLDRLLLGSVAEAVVRRSPVTVTVVR